MGSSKIIMLSGVYLILGFYTVSFYQADRSNGITVEAVANSVQAEQLARTGISMALSTMGSDLAVNSFEVQTIAMCNGTISYFADPLTATTSHITTTALFNGRRIIMTADVTYDLGRWRIAQIYTTPTAEEIN